MSTSHDRIAEALRMLPSKPGDAASASEKKRYSELLSQNVAYALAAELRDLGMAEARPSEPGLLQDSGAERRMSGGIGAKKVDVTWATEESGLLCAISIKSINFKDNRAGNFQKNLTNRRGDLLIEAVTLHRHFQYAVLLALFFFDEGARTDDTDLRTSTFLNAHTRFKLFTKRPDPAARDEQFEAIYIVLINADKDPPFFEVFHAGDPDTPVSFDRILDGLLRTVVERNSDFYEYRDGRILKRRV